MKLYLDSTQAPENQEDFAWFRSADMAMFSISLNEKKGCPYEGIDIGCVFQDFTGCDGIKFLEWLEETGRNYPVQVHGTDSFGKDTLEGIAWASKMDTMEEIIRRNGWDRLMHYTVGFAVEGRACVETRGTSPEEAAQKAVVDFCNVDLGELECVDFKPVIAYDENDEIIDDCDIANGDWYKSGKEQNYTVGFKVDCRAYVDVIARSPAEAVQKAESAFCMVALGVLEVNEWKPVHAVDEKGKLYDDDRDLFGNDETVDGLISEAATKCSEMSKNDNNKVVEYEKG